MLTTLALLFLFGGFCAAAVLPDRRSARVAGILASLAALATMIVAAAHFDPSVAGPQLAELALPLGDLGHRPLLAIDGIALPWVIVTPLLTLVVLVAAPRAELDRSNVQDALLTSAATLGLLTSQNVALFAFFWIAALIPAAVRIWMDPRFPKDLTLRRAFTFPVVGTTALVVAVVVMLVREGQAAGLDAPMDLAALASLHGERAVDVLPFVLLLGAIALRKGLFPFHSWVPLLVSRGPIGVTALLIGLHPGLFTLARLAIPLWPHASAAAMPYVADFALVGMLAASAVALVQHELSRSVGYVSVSQAGLMVVGAASMNVMSLQGALTQSVGIGISVTGLILLTRAVHARCGTDDVRYLGGLVRRMPRATWLFFVLAAATVGFPGFVGFVGEDLLIHGVLDAHPAVATIMLVATALNGITLFRAFARGFLGRPHGRSRTEGVLPLEDLLPRERWAAAGLIVLVLGAGLLPMPLLQARQTEVQHLVGSSEP